MSREFTVRWEGDLPGTPEQVWDAITARGAGVTLTPAGMAPIEGVVDYATPAFLGVRGADGSPDAWSTWLAGVFSDGAVN